MSYRQLEYQHEQLHPQHHQALEPQSTYHDQFSNYQHSSSASTATLQQQQQQQSEFGSLTLDNTLEDLSSRFIVNLPAEELESMERVCFQIEQAHWYYEDFVRPAARNPSLLPSFSLKHFSLLMFKSCPLLDDLVSRHAEIWTSFMAYKERVPVCGAILISKTWDKVLLVKGYQKGASWSFPRGKINKEEPEIDCAIREVLEETGYDLFPHFPADSVQVDGIRNPYYVELVIKEQRIRLYFVPDVSEETIFETQTRKEISKIEWFSLNDLPTWKNGKKVQPTTKQPKYFMVTPFVSHLKLWIQKNKPKGASIRHEFPPHLQNNIHYDRPSDSEDTGLDTSASETTSDTEGEYDSETGHDQFESAEAGSLALEAFFFGAVSPSTIEDQTIVIPASSDHFLADLTPTRATHPSFTEPLPAFSIHSANTAQPSPPVLAYERQQPLVQPRRKQTSRQTSLLLALLTDLDPVASPPPGQMRTTSTSTAASAATQRPPTLLDTLFGKPISSQQPSRSTISSHEIMFGHATPPIEAEGFGETRALTESQRGTTERVEKHNALLRALDTLGSPGSSNNNSHSINQVVPKGGGSREEKEYISARENGSEAEIQGTTTSHVNDSKASKPNEAVSLSLLSILNRGRVSVKEEIPIAAPIIRATMTEQQMNHLSILQRPAATSTSIDPLEAKLLQRQHTRSFSPPPLPLVNRNIAPPMQPIGQQPQFNVPLQQQQFQNNITHQQGYQLQQFQNQQYQQQEQHRFFNNQFAPPPLQPPSFPQQPLSPFHAPQFNNELRERQHFQHQQQEQQRLYQLQQEHLRSRQVDPRQQHTQQSTQSPQAFFSPPPPPPQSSPPVIQPQTQPHIISESDFPPLGGNIKSVETKKIKEDEMVENVIPKPKANSANLLSLFKR